MANFDSVKSSFATGEITFLEVVEYWAGVRPTETAVSAGNEEISYCELLKMTLHFASRFVQLGLGPQDVVAVSMGRSLELIPTLIAIWSVGAAYVPVDPSYPAERRRYILSDSGAKIIIADERGDCQFSGQVVVVAELLAGLNESTSSLPEPDRGLSNDLAYLIYTSGSTGVPKGVMVSFGNLANFLVAMEAAPGMRCDDRLLATTTISFDIHVLELFLPLFCGAHVVLASAESVRSQHQVRQLIDDGQITFMQATPTTWRLVLAAQWKPKLPLKILVGGEAFPIDLLPDMLICGREIWNMYGPTETTVWSLCSRVSESDLAAGPSIGLPIRATSVFVVNDQDQIVTTGETGELLIGGAGVASGYHKNKELTAKKFVLIPSLSKDCLYRTGDLVRKNEDGTLQYINRLDGQLKIRGFRIEPGDVERAIAQYPGVTDVAVVASEFGVGDTRLMGCVILQGEPEELKGLRKHCADRLPPHMVPQHFIVMSDFPKTNNQKLDRRALAQQCKNYLDIGSGEQAVARGEARDDRDRSIIAVWESALGVKDVGIDDNFFELGGHSLLVFSVVESMNKATGLSYSPADLFERPSIRTLLSVIAGEQGAASVVPINHCRAEETPVFCLCGVNVYSELAQHFDSNPVYGMFAKQEIALINAACHDQTMMASIPQLVEAYTDAIVRQDKYREVILVGLSFGGILAVEVAKSLRQKGIHPKAVVLLDSYLPGATRRTAKKLFVDVAQRVRYKGVAKSALAVIQRLARWSSRRFTGVSRVDVAVSEPALSEKSRDRLFDQISTAYPHTARQYTGNLLLIKATNTDFGLGFEPYWHYGWENMVVGQLLIETVVADHLGMMKGEAATSVYKHIARFLGCEVVK